MSEAGIRFSIKTVFDESQLKEMVSKLPEAKKVANRQAGFAILEDIGDRFENQGSPPAKWKPLAPKTLKAINRKYGPGPHMILNRNGTLKNSWMVGDSENVFKVGVNQVIVGTKLIYAAPHQFGWEDKNIPARPMAVPPEESPELLSKLERIYGALLQT